VVSVEEAGKLRRSVLKNKNTASETKLGATKTKKVKEKTMASMQFLSKEQLYLVQYAIEGKGLSSEILASSNKGTDTVKHCSMQTLPPGTWLNDEVINYCIKIFLAKYDQKICYGDSKGRK
jgi:hypothetical protein